MKLSTFLAVGAGLHFLIRNPSLLSAFGLVFVTETRVLEAYNVWQIQVRRLQSVNAAAHKLVDQALVLTMLTLEGEIVAVLFCPTRFAEGYHVKVHVVL